MTKSKAHLVITLRRDDSYSPSGLVLLAAGIYSYSNSELTQNFKHITATVHSAEAETFSEACAKVMEHVRSLAQHKHLPAWGRLLELLETEPGQLTA